MSTRGKINSGILFVRRKEDRKHGKKRRVEGEKEERQEELI